MDAAVSAVGLVVSAPFLLAACIWIRWDSPGSPFYGQTRIGRNGKPFTLFKLRSMRPVPELTSSITHGSGDPRITRPGRWLRRTKLDELPQLWNVLVGEMSLVGPRPCLPIQQEVIEARRNRQVFSVRPGITGLAQIRDIDMSDGPKLAEADAQWLEQGSVRTYLETILQTLRGKGSGDRVGRDQSAVE